VADLVEGGSEQAFETDPGNRDPWHMGGSERTDGGGSRPHQRIKMLLS
jgi:hypothetical protein